MASRLAIPSRQNKGNRHARRSMFESLESRTLLTSGPRIVAITPTQVINATFDHVDVTFNEPIAPATFTTDDVSLTGPPDLGAISATSVTQLDPTDYRISFNALSERGTYQIAVGPNITDTSGNLMDQNLNGFNGELGDKFASPLSYVVADTVFTSPVTISESDTSYDGQNIVIEGTTVTIDAPHNFNSVQLISGAVLTHSANTATETHELDLNVTEQVIVDSSSKIDVTGKGYLGGRTTGNTTEGAATAKASASYGGLGEMGPGASTNAVYGNYADPDEWGSGGGGPNGAAGGGLVRLTADTLELNGQVLANGQAVGGFDSGDGSGGGIYVSVKTLVGTGLIKARGGGGSYPGGGGRIAVYASDLTSFDTSRITAEGDVPASDSPTVRRRERST